MVEQTGAELDPQDPPHGVVDPAHLHAMAGDELGAEITVVGRDHLHVGPRVERLLGGLRTIGGKAVTARAGVRIRRRACPQLGHSGVVTLNEAVKAPPVLQDLRLRVFVGAARHAVERVERAHRRVGAGLVGRLERRQVHVEQPLERHVGRVVVTSRLRLPVGDEVLHARDDLVRRGVVVALGALHPGGRHHRVEVRILAGSLGDPAPSRLVRDVDHRAVDLLDADRRRLKGTDPVIGEGDVRIKAARRPKRDREDRPVPVNRVVREQDRDVQPRGHREVLEVVDLRRIRQAEDPADRLARLGIGDLPIRLQGQLVQLVLQRHLAHQRIHSALDVLVRGMPGRRQRRLVVARSSAGRNHCRGPDQRERERSRQDRGRASSPTHVSSYLSGRRASVGTRERGTRRIRGANPGVRSARCAHRSAGRLRRTRPRSRPHPAASSPNREDGPTPGKPRRTSDHRPARCGVKVRRGRGTSYVGPLCRFGSAAEPREQAASASAHRGRGGQAGVACAIGRGRRVGLGRCRGCGR